jgi:tetratricopeptide (TPR) repeat protein
MLKFRPAGLFLTAAVLVVPLFAQTVPLDALLRGGRIHYEGQRFERAREQFQKALDQYGATADNVAFAQIQTWLGLCEAQLRNYAPAAEHFVLAQDRDTATAGRIRANEQWQYHAGVALLNTTRDNYFAQSYEPALRFARVALRVDPTKSAIYSLIANIYSQLGRYEEMRATALDLLKLDARSAEAFGLLGLYFLQKPDSLWPDKTLRQARWDSAAANYDQAIAMYVERYDRARSDYGQMMKLTDSVRLDAQVGQLISRSRAGQEVLRSYIEQDLKAGRQLGDIAGIASRLHVSANNLNVTNSRAGSAMLTAAAQAAESTAERFRTKAETYFSRAVQYDSTDLTALFDLGIAYYQGRNDSAAEQALRLVAEGSRVGLGLFPAAVQDSLVGRIADTLRPAGSLQLDGPLAAAVDSIAPGLGGRGTGFTWFYFPALRDRTGPVLPDDRAAMFVSSQQPQLLEQALLWLGSSQTGLGTALTTDPQNDGARARYRQAIENLLLAAQLNPKSADAYQNLGICYRELGDKQKALAAFEKADKIRKGK